MKGSIRKRITNDVVCTTSPPISSNALAPRCAILTISTASSFVRSFSKLDRNIQACCVIIT